MSTAETEAQEAKAGREWWFWILLLADLYLLFLLTCSIFSAIHRPTGMLRIEAKNYVTGVTAAIKAYYTEYGTMPTGSNAEIIRVLRGDNPRKVVFFETDLKRISPAGELHDPWKQPYRIDTTEPGKPWVYSCGPDKQDNGGAEGSDDVVNWR